MTADRIPPPDSTLTTYQADFYRRFLGELQAGSTHLLVAPVGTGKSYAMSAAIAALMRSRPFGRTLILAPALLAEQWVHHLARWGVQASLVDTKMFRLLRSKTGSSHANWPCGVFATSIDLAKRRDVQDTLVMVRWDLVVADEAHQLTGQRLSLVRSLANETPAPALLLATATPTAPLLTLVPAANRFDWHEAVSLFRERQDAAAGGPLMVRETLPYVRTADETALVQSLLACARRLDPATASALLRRGASSVSSLEETLLGWVDDDNSLGGHREVAEDLLARVERVSSDSRLDAFRALVRGLGSAAIRHTVAFCEYRTTQDYLAAAVEDLNLRVSSLHGGMASTQRRDVVAEFQANGGLLFTTSAASEGTSLNFVEAAIHFDLPASPVKFAQREGRYSRHGRDVPCVVYFFVDKSGSYPIEDLLQRMVAKYLKAGDLADFDFEKEVAAVLS